MNWLVLLFAIELGFAPSYRSLNVTPNTVGINITENIGYVLFEVEVVAWDTLFVGGSIKSYVQFMKDDLTNYHPFEIDNYFNAGLRFGQIEVGYKHRCIHPERPYEIIYRSESSRDASYDEFYVRMEFKK